MHDYRGSSFLALLKTDYPELVPPLDGVRARDASLVQATTICCLRYDDGVLIGGDRRATIDGHIIMNEDVVKVYKVDDHSAMAIAGTFGPSVKMVRLFQVELEHYEKIEGIQLTLAGKANKLSQMLEQNLPAAMQGLMVVPLYAGFDREDQSGKIFEYDVTGGVFTKTTHEPYASSGSGGERAKMTFEHFWREGLTKEEAVALMEKALVFAAKRDTATGGTRQIIMAVTADGVEVVRGDDVSEAGESE